MALDGPKALLISHMEMSDTAAVDGPISRLTSVLETTFVSLDWPMAVTSRIQISDTAAVYGPIA